jgi:pyruvate/2-oxoglutarate dehydrogenase complex dihydrolipoamide dehydrogenase (E3) component
MKRFDAIILGAGQAGPPLAGRLTAAGMTVALVERKLFGGTCVNTGCKPTKTLVASARAAYIARRAADFGVVLEGAFRIDMARVKERVDEIVIASREGIRSWLDKMDRCTVLEGHARFESESALRVGDEVIGAERIFINVGGRARIPPMPGLDATPHLTNTSMLAMTTLPSHLLVVGGSYVGLEFAQIYRRLGCKVTVVEQLPRIIPREDEDVSEAMTEILESEGITVRAATKCIAFDPEESRASKGVTMRLECESDDRILRGSHVLLAVGRVPNTDDLGLDRAGVAMDERGHILVDDQLRTNVKGIWALGDCNGRGAFTHTSYNDFEIVAANLLDDDPRRVSDRIDAYALYTDPPLGRAGMTEAAARKTGRPLLVGKRPMTRVGRAVEKDEQKGFMKVVIDAETKKILGAAILGVEGDEAIHGILDMMYAGATARTLQRTVGIHPTVSELIPTLVAEAVPLT